MAGPKTNFTGSIKFLERFHPDRLWVMTAVQPDRKGIETRTFDASMSEDLVEWLKGYEDRNIYFSVNEPIGPLAKKSEKTDIKAAHWLHVDLDPRVGENLEVERTRILAVLQEPPEEVPVPTVIVFSGGGYQGFWRLDAPVPIDGSIEKAEQFERYNIQLEIVLGGDSCFNVDRIMRLPGTVNRPNRKKREKGRTEELAKMITGSGKTYSLDDFTPAAEVQNNSQQFNSTTVQVSGNIKRLGSVDDLPAGVPDMAKVVIVQGIDPDNPAKWPSRSEALFWICCELVRAGCDDDTIFSVITDPDFLISESVLEKKSNAAKYALHNIQNAREDAIDPWLRKLNDSYAVIGDLGGKCRIISERDDIIDGVRRKQTNSMSFADFRNFWCNKFIEIGYDNKKEQPIFMPVGKWWVNHQARREYNTLIFAPGHDIPGAYNLWKGFAFDARPGDCNLYLDHVRKNICGDDDEAYTYLLGWMATAVQHPDRPGHAAVVLRGRMGTGKGRFAYNFGTLFGRHFLPIRDPNHLFGTFNAHLRDCVILFADEAFASGNIRHENMLNSLITEETVMVEAKGYDAEAAQNYVHLIMASNEDWIVPARADDRRFFVLDVSDERRRDIEYFKAMQDQLEAGGFEALLHYLMSYDLSEFSIQNIPQTSALHDQKINTLSSEEEWWFAKLKSGRLMENKDGWPSEIFSTEFYYDFISYHATWKLKARSSPHKLGKFLRKIFPVDWVHRTQLSGEHHVMQVNGIGIEVQRPYVNQIPSLDYCRESWQKNYGGPKTWDEVDIRNDIKRLYDQE